jgi:hypothetical protein
MHNPEGKGRFPIKQHCPWIWTFHTAAFISLQKEQKKKLQVGDTASAASSSTGGSSASAAGSAAAAAVSASTATAGLLLVERRMKYDLSARTVGELELIFKTNNPEVEPDKHVAAVLEVAPLQYPNPPPNTPLHTQCARIHLAEPELICNLLASLGGSNDSRPPSPSCAAVVSIAGRRWGFIHFLCRISRGYLKGAMPM